MGFHLDHLALEQAVAGPLTDALLQTFDQGLVLLHGAGSHRHMVVFRKDPRIEIRGHVSAHIHFSQAFVILHLLRRQLDALLEGDRHVVVAGIHRFGHAAVGAIGTHDQINLQGPGFAGGLTSGVVGIGEGVGALSVGTGVDLGD